MGQRRMRRVVRGVQHFELRGSGLQALLWRGVCVVGADRGRCYVDGSSDNTATAVKP